jgi:hypothetical protein
MPNQKVGWSWKSKVPPVPSCFGRVGGCFGSVRWYDWLFPEPGVFE